MHSKQQPAALVPALLNWFASNARDLPWRRTSDPYAIWISEIMLQQTQVKTVIPYWERWMRALPNVCALAQAKPESVLKLWEGLGYYSRARNAQSAAKIIMGQHGGKFPTDFDEILNLPGIGRYTAGAICSIAFNQPTPILDGNVSRVLARAFAIKGDVKSKQVNARLWELAEKLVKHAHELPDRRLQGVSDCALQIAENCAFDPSAYTQKTGSTLSPILAHAGNCSRLNQSLMELGATVCTPTQPRCHECPIQGLCTAHQSGRADKFPTVSKRPVITHRHFAAFVVTRNDKFLVRQRPAGVVNSGFWEFPNVELTHGNPSTAAAPFTPLTPKPFMTLKHSITRYRIRLDVYTADLSANALVQGNWLSISKLTKLPFTSAHRKILAKLA